MRDFNIRNGIHLVQPPYELDLHNVYDFIGLHYSVEHRTLLLRWRRAQGEWIASDAPTAVSIEFQEVSEFRFLPRKTDLPFTEDDCVNAIGYWTDEDWADGVIIAEPGPDLDPTWLTAIHFMSGATIVVQAVSANARIDA